MFKALAKFAKVHEYSWHTPGHTGGTAFLKTAAGRDFFNFFGEQIFRSDLSISVGELGSMLDHSGPIGESEKYMAEVFNATRSYHVTNGTSTSNRIVLMASLTRDDICLCDRNCHKSVEHAMTLTGAVPTYLVPTRNQYGIIGPILPEKLTSSAVKEAIKSNPLINDNINHAPKHAIITNSTYDGLCYQTTWVKDLLKESVSRIHFDEAWYGYAHFNPIYHFPSKKIIPGKLDSIRPNSYQNSIRIFFRSSGFVNNPEYHKSVKQHKHYRFKLVACEIKDRPPDKKEISRISPKSKTCSQQIIIHLEFFTNIKFIHTSNWL